MTLEDLKVGDNVFCIGGGFRIESVIVEINTKSYKPVRISDGDVSVWVGLNEIEFDKSHNRNKILELWDI